VVSNTTQEATMHYFSGDDVEKEPVQIPIIPGVVSLNDHQAVIPAVLNPGVVNLSGNQAAIPSVVNLSGNQAAIPSVENLSDD
jgi:hypothetical protein